MKVGGSIFTDDSCILLGSASSTREVVWGGKRNPKDEGCMRVRVCVRESFALQCEAAGWTLLMVLLRCCFAIVANSCYLLIDTKYLYLNKQRCLIFLLYFTFWLCEDL